MKHFINIKDIPSKDLKKIILDAKIRKTKRKNFSTLDSDKDSPLKGKLLIQMLMDNKLLTIRAAENVIRILPPLNVKKKEIDLALKIIKKVCLTYK